MQNFEGSVCVITGGASGLGFAMAKEAQKRGCKLVIGDIREDALKEAEFKLSAGGDVLAVKCDVSKSGDLERLAQSAVDRFGKVNILINNAGIFASGVTWEISEDEYNWVIDVNQRSVFNGIRSFVPRMIRQGDPCHVVTISSGAGITVNPGFATYSMTKHAVVALTEALYLDLRAQEIPNIGVSIVMPGMTQSGIMSPEKTTPGALQAEVGNRKSNNILKALETLMTAGVAEGFSAEELARMVFDTVKADELYVLPAFDDETNRAFATAVGMGRATAVNPYPEVVEGFLATLKEIENAG